MRQAHCVVAMMQAHRAHRVVAMMQAHRAHRVVAMMQYYPAPFQRKAELASCCSCIVLAIKLYQLLATRHSHRTAKMPLHSVSAIRPHFRKAELQQEGAFIVVPLLVGQAFPPPSTASPQTPLGSRRDFPS